MSSASQAADKLLDETIGQQPHGLEEVSHRGCSWNLLRKGTRDRNSLRTEEESWIRRENEARGAHGPFQILPYFPVTNTRTRL